MRLSSIALAVTVCASCAAPVTPPGNGVYTPDVATVVLVHHAAWLPPPPGPCDTCNPGGCQGAAEYTLAVASHTLAWSVCNDDAPSGSIDGSRVLTADEWTMLEATLDVLAPAEPIVCGADPTQFDLILTTADGIQRAYGDASHDCGLADQPRVGSDELDTVELAIRTLAGA